jgi:hypothetical protein
LSVHAAPNGFAFTMRARFFLGAVTLSTSRPGLRLCLGDLDDFSINAAPPISSSASWTIPARFLFRRVTLKLSLASFRLGNPNGFSVYADPARLLDYTATAARLLFGSVPLTASFIAIRPGHRDDAHAGGCINAAPTQTSVAAAASFARFVFRTVALTFPFLAIRRVGLDDDLAFGSLDAAPTRPAMRSRFLFGRVTLKLSLSGFRLGNPNRLAV